ncbi:MAG: hypothetical protein CSA32_00210 [Desulfobulbus propionicus]|nr:MAG: hypothetical protein CSA32_00210 [Desulfobulbus propionicus]
MTKNSLPAFIRALQEPMKYPHPVKDVSLVQTHISYVLLAGDFVYKFKKPVDFGFLDFSELEKRKSCCQRELVLNRRLCPDIYLDLVQVTELDGQFALNGEGAVIEYGVRMARMPEERMMGKVIRAGQLTLDQLDRLVDVLIPFYQKAQGGKEIDSFGRAEAVSVNVLENFEQTESFVGQEELPRERYETIVSYAQKMLSDKELFDRRVNEGRIRDCHGDLYSANICLADKVYIYDCIEFNDRFRYSDIASDVAFLAMDLDFHGLEPFSRRFIERFCDASEDPGLLDVLDFYKCYRAYVRGKIGLFTAGDPAVAEEVRKACLTDSARYFQLAEQYAVFR